ncbi:MAG: DUF6541 family protein [Eggerthellaceae bacterium]|nr:DUF6541 family protein [Eggerthellaceae bacterium]
MWFSFFAAVLIVLALLYVPGCLFLKALRFDGLTSLICSPLLSAVAYEAIAVAFSKLGIGFTWYTAVAPVIMLGLISRMVSLALTRRKVWHIASMKTSRTDWLHLIIYLGIAALLVGYFFVRTLDTPASFNQDHDNVWHINLIQSFVQSGNYSPLDASLYHDSNGINAMPIESTGSFYPSLWHCVGALVVSVLDCPIPVAVNALNCVILAVLLPSSAFFLLRQISPNDSKITLCGSVICLAFGAFPWRFVTFGPLYPNLLGFALVPMAVAIFIAIFGQGKSREHRIRYALLYIFGVVALACAHPNSVFTAAVILIPFCIYSIFHEIGVRSLSRRRRCFWQIVCCGFFIVFVAAIWIILYGMPFLQGVVGFSWEVQTLGQQELINILVLSFNEPSAQIALGAVVLAGVLYTIKEGKYLWITASYILACVICYFGATSSGLLKSVMTGFWYSDPYRVAAVVAIASLPLAAMGLSVISRFILYMLNGFFEQCGKILNLRFSFVALGFFFVLINYYPNYDVPGRYHVTTAFGDIEYKLNRLNDIKRSNILAPEEVAFLQKVKETVSSDGLILNDPEDGSFFAYGLYDLNIYYRSAGMTASAAQTENSSIIRTMIDLIHIRDDVKKAVSDTGAQYVLILDQGGEIEPDRHYYGYYRKSAWRGFNDITDYTPGFSVLLSEGDMRLYEITE